MEEQRKDIETEGNQKVVKMFGDHMDRRDVKAYVMRMLEQRQYLDSQCFAMLCSVVNGSFTAMGEEGRGKRAEAEALVKSRIDVNDSLLKVIAGDPATLKREFG